MKPNPYTDRIKYTDRIGRFPWWLAFGLAFIVLCILVDLLVGCAWSPKFAPLVTIEANGSANGNTATVPVHAVP